MRPVHEADPVSILIERKLVGLTPVVPDCCIFRVHHQLRKVNEKAYEPQLLAIGPYHHGKDGLGYMEEQKVRYLQLMLQRRSEIRVEEYINALRELEEGARRFYGECVSLTTDEFVEMMLLDGCFIIELLRKYANPSLRDGCDPIFEMEWTLCILQRDLLLFENQLPFFVLTKLLNMTINPQTESIIDLALQFFLRNPPPTNPCYRELHYRFIPEIKHLLDLIHKSTHYSSVQSRRTAGDDRREEEVHKSINSTTELQEAGIRFKKREGRLFDIKFDKGLMEIPTLEIEDNTESFFRNLIAYEQYSQNLQPKYVIEYVRFMDCLISSPKDVEVLRRSGIIVNWLGDDEVVSTMFNKLGDYVTVSNLRHAEIFKKVNEHCSRSRNVWMAKLRHDYFNSPWALLSFLAAALLLLLTSTQTIFSVLSYRKS